MKLPIRDQIMWPLLVLLLAAVAANAAFSAWWISTRSLRDLNARQQQIVGVLEESSFPLSQNVIEKLRRLTGDEILVWDIHEKQMLVGSLPEASLASITFPDEQSASTAQNQRLTVGDTTYLVHFGKIRNVPSQRLCILTPAEAIRKNSREAIWPPLAVGISTIILLIPLILLFASNWTRRIRSLEQGVHSIAGGKFGLELPTGSVDDEFARLVRSINSMSGQLQSLKDQLVRGERTRLVAQLTAGFAHQLRNGLAGAKLAVQLHESRCRNGSDTSLTVARNQLALVEEEIQGLLSLGKNDSRTPARVDVAEVLRAVQELVHPSCEHKCVELQTSEFTQPVEILGFADRLRSAVLNLTLNAMDATGPGGRVWLTLSSEQENVVVVVEDDGPGPPEELADSLFESFVSSKPEGVGLGLTVAATVAREHHGSLNWSREGNRTRFELKLPLAAAVEKRSA